MASNPPGECCIRGSLHEGTPKGTYAHYGGVEAYVVGDKAKASTKLLLFYPDVMGHRSINAQLVADQYAENGFYVIVPDQFQGDPVPVNQPKDFDLFGQWLPKHLLKTSKPYVDKAVEAILSEHKPKEVAAVGYCYGAQFVVDHLGSGKAQVGAVAHPSFVTLEAVKAIKGPLFIAGAEIDKIYTEDLRHQTEAALRDIKAEYFTTLASGVEHGFAVRGDPNKPLDKFAKEKAFADFVHWFHSHSKA